LTSTDKPTISISVMFQVKKYVGFKSNQLVRESRLGKCLQLNYLNQRFSTWGTRTPRAVVPSHCSAEHWCSASSSQVFPKSFLCQKQQFSNPRYATRKLQTLMIFKTKYPFIYVTHTFRVYNYFFVSFWGSMSSKRFRATGLKCSVRGYFCSQVFRNHFQGSKVFLNMKKVGNHCPWGTQTDHRGYAKI
jgi:hypothetical protein